jgi:triacylglycerol lipase
MVPDHMAKHRIFLVPGFFGFANLGEFYYFGHLADLLEEAFLKEGHSVEVVRVNTHPTASVRVRAIRLLQAMAETSASDECPLHIIGHSTGGLDARLLLSPGVRLGEGHEPERYAARVKTLVCASTPNRGTPLANFFISTMGAQMLRLLSLATVYSLRFGHLPLSFVLRFGALLGRVDKLVGWSGTLIDQLFTDLLSDFSPARRDAVQAFFTEVGDEQALIQQLTPEAMELFNASTVDRPGLACASVLSCARAPTLGSILDVGMNPYAQATRSIYALLHRQTGRRPIDPKQLPTEHTDRIRVLFGKLPGPRDSDGVVPTLSQPWGDVLGVVRADHLDIIGHFSDKDHKPPHIDWLSSGTRFTTPLFQSLWGGVARWMLARAL